MACGWSVAGQLSRFAAVLSAASPRPGERILDFGCGLGGFSDWLPADVEYVGFDTAPGMVTRAAREHPGRVFTTGWPSTRFDVVVAIGTFNLPGSKERTFHTLRHLWDTSGCRMLAVSLYAGDDENCLRYTEADCEPLLGEAFRSTVERWRQNDLLVVLER